MKPSPEAPYLVIRHHQALDMHYLLPLLLTVNLSALLCHHQPPRYRIRYLFLPLNSLRASSSRPKASNYVDVVNAILVRTMFDYEGLVSTHDAFPSPALRRVWALRCWKKASKDADEFYDLFDRMGNLVSSFYVHRVAC